MLNQEQSIRLGRAYNIAGEIVAELIGDEITFEGMVDDIDEIARLIYAKETQFAQEIANPKVEMKELGEADFAPTPRT